MEKIVSGGQTGVDRAALDVALALGLATGGWIPRGRRAEDGLVPMRYPGLVEAESETYETRTRLNVRDADATLVLCLGPPSGGTALTLDSARALARPWLRIDLAREGHAEAARRIRSWLAAVRPRVLNVAGPRASEAPRIADATARVLRRALGTDPCVAASGGG